RWRRRDAAIRRSALAQRMSRKSPTGAAPAGRWPSPCAPPAPRPALTSPAAPDPAADATSAAAIRAGRYAAPASIVRPQMSWTRRTYQHPRQGKPEPGRRRRGPGSDGSVRQRHARIDQAVERRLHIDVGLDHAGLLEREPRRQDRVTLRRADLVVGDVGALLELLVDDFAGQLGRGDE